MTFRQIDTNMFNWFIVNNTNSSEDVSKLEKLFDITLSLKNI